MAVTLGNVVEYMKLWLGLVQSVGILQDRGEGGSNLKKGTQFRNGVIKYHHLEARLEGLTCN